MICKNCGQKVYAKEICDCGEKAPNPHGKGVAVNSVICTIILVLSVFAFIATASLRNIVNKNLLVKTIEQVDLCSLEIEDDGSKVKLDQYIYDEFIGDERITVENVDNIPNPPFIKEFVIEKIEGYQDFFMDRGDMEFITSDDIVNLIDENSELLYNEAGLNFLGPDKEALKSDLSVLDDFSRFCNDYLTGWFTGGLIQTYFSLLFLNFLEVLFVIILIQWLLVYRFNGRRMSSALRKYSLAVIIPSGIVFADSMTMLFYDKNSIAGAFTSQIRNTFIISSAIVLGFGIVLLIISILTGRKKKPAAVNTVSDAAETKSAENTITEAKESVSDTSFAPSDNSVQAETSIQSEPKKVFCIKCGAENKENSKFCSKCGEKLI